MEYKYIRIAIKRSGTTDDQVYSFPTAAGTVEYQAVDERQITRILNYFAQDGWKVVTSGPVNGSFLLERDTGTEHHQ